MRNEKPEDTAKGQWARGIRRADTADAVAKTAGDLFIGYSWIVSGVASWTKFSSSMRRAGDDDPEKGLSGLQQEHASYLDLRVIPL